MKKKSIAELIAEYDERIADTEECIAKVKDELQRLTRSTNTDERVFLERKLYMYYDIYHEQVQAQSKLKKYCDKEMKKQYDNK